MPSAASSSLNLSFTCIIHGQLVLYLYLSTNATDIQSKPRRPPWPCRPPHPIELVNNVYATLDAATRRRRRRLGRGLTLAEKILFNHLDDANDPSVERGLSYNDLRPDRVAMQDATAQMALLQFMTAGLPTVAVPSTVHCDHLIQAKVGAKTDLLAAENGNKEVYDFLESVSAKYGIGFWGPGSGIIHQVVLEQYAFPGGMMIGTDSHTPNAGGLGMIAIGVGGADAVDVMTGFPFNVRWPKLIGVHLTGELNGWTAPKDVILKVAEILTVKGGTGAIVEYFGPGADSTQLHRQGDDLQHGRRDRRHHLAVRLRRGHGALPPVHRTAARSPMPPTPSPTTSAPTTRCWPTPATTSTRSSRSTSTTLRPHINGPHTPDLAREVGELGAEARANGWPLEISSALVGSCTNSSYEDITRAASILRHAAENGLQRQGPAPDHPRFRAGAGDHRARRAARHVRGRRRHGAGQRLRPVHRTVVAARTK